MHSKDRLFFVLLIGTNVSDTLSLIHTTGQKIANYFLSSLHTYSKRYVRQRHNKKINLFSAVFEFGDVIIFCQSLQQAQRLSQYTW